MLLPVRRIQVIGTHDFGNDARNSRPANVPVQLQHDIFNNRAGIGVTDAV